MDNTLMTRLAETGAAVRVRELKAEIDALLQAFPSAADHTNGPVDQQRQRRAAKTATEATLRTAVASKARKPMSAAKRKAIGRRMRAYWKARRAAAKG